MVYCTYVCCEQENNPCKNKENCKRYLTDGNMKWKMFRFLCNEENGYQLFMQKDDDNKENNIKKIEDKETE